MRAFAGLLGLLMTLALSPAAAAGPAAAGLAPPLNPDPQVWLNSAPLDWDKLRGKVVLVNVWTYGCGNCERSLPWLKALYAEFRARRFEIVGVHSPEFAWEKPQAAVTAAMARRGVTWPVMQDNDLAYWRALGNRYWPAFYVVDRQGRVAGRFIGETHAADANARAMERLIETLLSAG